MEQGARACSTELSGVLPLIIESFGSLVQVPDFKVFLVLSS